MDKNSHKPPDRHKFTQPLLEVDLHEERIKYPDIVPKHKNVDKVDDIPKPKPSYKNHR